MKKTNNSIIFLFILLLPFLLNAQQEINISTENADLYYYDESILITPIDSDIVLSGKFFTYKEFNEISILIIPQNGFSVIIIPNQGENKTSVGIGEGDDKSISIINIHPNPTKNKITINAKQKIKKIEIYNTYGIKQSINQKTSLNNDTILNLENYKKGLYILKIYLNNNTVINKTIIKQ